MKTAARPILQEHHLQRAYTELSTSQLRAGPWPTTLQEALAHPLYGPLTRILGRRFALTELQQQRAALRAALPRFTHDARGLAAHHHEQ